MYTEDISFHCHTFAFFIYLHIKYISMTSERRFIQSIATAISVSIFSLIRLFDVNYLWTINIDCCRVISFHYDTTYVNQRNLSVRSLIGYHLVMKENFLDHHVFKCNLRMCSYAFIIAVVVDLFKCMLISLGVMKHSFQHM